MNMTDRMGKRLAQVVCVASVVLAALFAQGGTVAYWPMVMDPETGGTARKVADASGNNYPIVEAGGPANCCTMVRIPTMETLDVIMESPKVQMLIGTGGEAMVHTLMSSSKKVIAAGPGNPPTIVDETTDVKRRRSQKKTLKDKLLLSMPEIDAMHKAGMTYAAIAERLKHDHRRLYQCEVVHPKTISKVYNEWLRHH